MEETKNINRLLIIIDPQKDFTTKEGSLYVPNAEKTIGRINRYFAVADVFPQTKVCITMDSHRKGHISLPQFWANEKGEHPKPFTQITAQDVAEGRWCSWFSTDWAQVYLNALEAKGKKHTIWPEHCIIGTSNWEVDPMLFNGRDIIVSRYVYKGDNPLTEFFSALKAEVSIETFPETLLNQELLDYWNSFDEVILSGFCADYCVKETLRDIVENSPELTKKLQIRMDLIAPLDKNFDFHTDDVYVQAVEKGATLCTSSIQS